MKFKKISTGNKAVVARDRTRPTKGDEGILGMMELFCTLTVVVVT